LKEQDRNFKVIGMRRSDLGKIIKTAREHDGTTDHSGDFEIRESLVIEHPIKFQLNAWARMKLKAATILRVAALQRLFI